MRPKSLKSLLTALVIAREPILITGRPGVGKSEIVEQACAQVGADLIISHPVVSDPTDFKGLPFMNPNGEANFIPLGDLRKILHVTRPTVFFLDDLGQASTSVQAAAMQLILARQINGHKVSDLVTFVAATNRREDKAGVSGVLEPLKSRFTIVELEPTLEDWVDWALHQDWLPMELVAAVRFRPKWVTEWNPSKAIENTPTPRNLAVVGKMMSLNLPDDTAFSAYAGRLGEAAATELMAFMRLYLNLPTAAEIAASPLSAPVPSDPSSLYALIGSLTGAATDKTFEPFVQYVNRIPKEYGVLFMRDITRKNKNLQSTRSFVKWATENKDIIL